MKGTNKMLFPSGRIHGVNIGDWLIYTGYLGCYLVKVSEITADDYAVSYIEGKFPLYIDLRSTHFEIIG